VRSWHDYLGYLYEGEQDVTFIIITCFGLIRCTLSFHNLSILEMRLYNKGDKCKCVLGPMEHALLVRRRCRGEGGGDRRDGVGILN